MDAEYEVDEARRSVRVYMFYSRLDGCAVGSNKLQNACASMKYSPMITVTNARIQIAVAVMKGAQNKERDQALFEEDIVCYGVVFVMVMMVGGWIDCDEEIWMTERRSLLVCECGTVES